MLKEKYNKEIVPQMMKEFGYKNPLDVPKVQKVVVNIGVGKILSDLDGGKKKDMIKDISSNLALICGQKPIMTLAKKAISGFKTRQGALVGFKVTLRGSRMYDFLERLINLALPRLRDFQGIKIRAIDNGGNLTVGVKEHIVFPEIQPEKTKIIFGFGVVVVVNKGSKKETIKLFRLMGFPIKHSVVKKKQ